MGRIDKGPPATIFVNKNFTVLLRESVSVETSNQQKSESRKTSVKMQVGFFDTYPCNGSMGIIYI